MYYLWQHRPAESTGRVANMYNVHINHIEHVFSFYLDQNMERTLENTPHTQLFPIHVSVL